MKYRLRVGWRYFKLRLRSRAQPLLHGRVRCVVLGHDHSVAKHFPGIFTGGEVKVEWVKSTDASAGQLVEDLVAGTSITEIMVEFTDHLPPDEIWDAVWGSEHPYLEPWRSE